MDLKEMLLQSQGHANAKINSEDIESGSGEAAVKQKNLRYKIDQPTLIAAVVFFLSVAFVGAMWAFSEAKSSGQITEVSSVKQTVQTKTEPEQNSSAASSSPAIESSSKNSADLTKTEDMAQLDNQSSQTDASELAIDTNGKVNINYADSEELTTLSGVGPKTAEKIVEYRKEHGKFTNPSQIMSIKGIGTSTYSKIKDKICI
jgi:competence protein ComEA